jgi:hypothetical protein
MAQLLRRHPSPILSLLPFLTFLMGAGVGAVFVREAGWRVEWAVLASGPFARGMHLSRKHCGADSRWIPTGRHSFPNAEVTRKRPE